MPGSKRGESRAQRLRRGRWSKAEQSRLKELWGRRSDVAIARELNRSVENVRKTAERLIRTGPRHGPWTAQEVQRLKESLGVTTEETIARILGRSPEEVRRQILDLGRIQQTGRWSREEVSQLKRLFGRRTDSDLAKILGRPPETIRRKAVDLCLSKDKAFLRRLNGEGSTRMPRWRGEELDLLRQMYPRYSNLDIAQRLDRSVKSIVSKAHHMGLKKDVERLKQMGRENVGLRYGHRP